MNNKITLTWLGQSGFLLHSAETEIACDLYLSDFCQKKSKLDHTRLMPVPVRPGTLNYINDYLITHGHIDHFDPETVGPILNSNPDTKFWCPPSCQKVIDEYLPAENSRFAVINSGKEYRLTANTSLIAIPAAHEELEKDSEGEYVCFSYIVLFATEKKAVFFAGDTIPFAGQSDLINKNIPDSYELTMVLPVNGRDKKRAELGFKGNMDIDEAIALGNACKASRLVPCHFGMFTLNDISETIKNESFKTFNGETIIPVLKGNIIL